MPELSPLLLRHQGPMLRTLGRVLLGAVGASAANDAEMPETPGPEVRARLEPRPDLLVDAYARWSGAPDGRYASTVPPHLFPQWGLPLSTRALGEVPFPMTRVLNQGCDVEVASPLPRGEQLLVRARLEDAESRSSGIRLRQRLVTGTPDDDEALAADIHALVPARRPRARGTTRRERPDGFEEVGRWDATVADARAFCWLTGDLNPIHWVPAIARKAGFPRPILHGFGILARTWEVLAGAEPDGAIRRLEARFTRPVVLPAAMHVLVGPPEDDGRRPVRLLDASGQPCLAGSVLFGS